MRTLCSIAALVLVACGSSPVVTSGDAGTTTHGANPISTAKAPPGCGDGELSENEACDDGNRKDGDGCSGNCLVVEPGFLCYPAGAACRAVARCGDGVVASSELCDDGNANDGDGCSAQCKLELGFACDGAPSRCRTTKCGDGKREGAESCDDGNTLPFDGCSATCQSEPDCAHGACTSTCGDGLVLGEACDDGNTKDGDGCSASCQVEKGFTCTDDSSCEQQNGQCILRVPVIYRDFNADHPDFEIGCGMLVTGVVAGSLDANGKPKLVDGSQVCIQSADTFAQWYSSNAQESTTVSELVLYQNGAGGFVNRYGPHGEPWLGPQTFSNVVYGGPGGTGCGMCTPSATGKCYDPCTPWGNGNTQACCAEMMQASYDGNPLFFPLDDAPTARMDTRLKAQIPEQYGYTGWPLEETVIPNAHLHDFSFTSEVVYWFRYSAGSAPTLEFTGDDDVWVFINDKLAVDLGGPHVPTSKSVTLDAAAASQFGLSADHVYPIHVFQAERKSPGSTFKLTLAGFDTSRSDCEPICGDGIVTVGEECDDGKNNGTGYGECAPGCKLGPHCGDGIVQGDEDCDDGNLIDNDQCPSDCRIVIPI